ncbi:MAG: porin [Acidobacteria bacterium]|nr:porin [Acidobacteriota bacterium]
MKLKNRALLAAGTLALAALIAGSASAQTAPAPKWYDGISLNGMVGASYSYNTNKPDSGLNGYRVFDFDDNTFKLDVVELVVQKPVAEAGDIGFRFDLTAGGSVPRIAASSGLFRDSVTGKAEDFDLQQGYVSWMPSSGFRIDFGKFITHMGAELIEGYDGYNDNFSRSILFGYAIPFTHTGLKASYAFSSSFSAMAMVANGWDNVKDNNRGKTFGAQLLFTPAPMFTAYLNYVGGPERSGSSDARHVFDVVAVIKPMDLVTLTLNYDYGKEKNGAGSHDAQWTGFAAIARFNISGTFALSVRGETFKDRDGARTGAAQRLTECTLTPEFKVKDRLVIRPEVRFDRSNESTFEKSGGRTSKKQTTLALNTLYVF